MPVLYTEYVFTLYSNRPLMPDPILTVTVVLFTDETSYGPSTMDASLSLVLLRCV